MNSRKHIDIFELSATLKGIIANREERLKIREEQLADIKKSIKNPIYGIKSINKYKKK